MPPTIVPRPLLRLPALRCLLGCLLSFLPTCLPTCLPSGPAAAQAPLTDRQDALRALQGAGLAGPDCRLAADVIDRTTRWIARIRRDWPATAAVHAEHADQLGSAMLFFDDATAARLRAREWRDVDGASMLQGSSGVVALDALQRRLDARLQRLAIGPTELWLAHFDETVDVPAAVARYREVDGVVDAGPSPMTGDGDEILLLRRGDRRLLVFKDGEGDCPAGCISNHYWYFEVDTTADTITAHDECPPAEARAVRIHRWGIPARFAATVFDDLDAALAAFASDDWWVALHAVEVVGRLLVPGCTPWVGEDLDRGARFERLRDQVAARRSAAFRALLTALVHADPAVADAALRHLRALTGLAHGRDERGIAAFEQWLVDHGHDR